MFFVIEFFLTIASYYLLNNYWIFIPHGLKYSSHWNPYQNRLSLVKRNKFFCWSNEILVGLNKYFYLFENLLRLCSSVVRAVDRQSKDLCSNLSAVESVFFSIERFSNSLNIEFICIICDIRAWNCLRGQLSTKYPIWYATSDPPIM